MFVISTIFAAFKWFPSYYQIIFFILSPKRYTHNAQVPVKAHHKTRTPPPTHTHTLRPRRPPCQRRHPSRLGCTPCRYTPRHTARCSRGRRPALSHRTARYMRPSGRCHRRASGSDRGGSGAGTAPAQRAQQSTQCHIKNVMN